MFNRREFLTLMGVGAVSSAGLVGCAAHRNARGRAPDFTFLQLTDTHWGFSGAPNPEAASTLPKAITAIEASGLRPDFIVFTGDLTHTTDDDAERRVRLQQFQALAQTLKAPLHFLPGEHDASLDGGEAFRERFGPSRWTFDRAGVRFIGLDNVSDASGQLGDEQLGWLRAQIEQLDRAAPVVVFAHRPLFDLYPTWDWATKDGARALEILGQRQENVTVFYGHIHQQHHFRTGPIEHHAAASLVFPLPAPGSVPKRAPLPWNPQHPFQGLGWRDVEGAPLVAREHALGEA